MSLGVIAGFSLAYPFNAWLVAKGLKHGLMTERTAVARDKSGTRASRRASGKRQRKPDDHAGHSMPGMAHDAQHQDRGAR
jgi:hypothetical protein